VARLLALGLRAHAHLDVDIQRVGDVRDGIQLALRPLPSSNRDTTEGLTPIRRASSAFER
jgi:hypothetical protein